GIDLTVVVGVEHAKSRLKLLVVREDRKCIRKYSDVQVSKTHVVKDIARVLLEKEYLWVKRIPMESLDY
ncbi:hypothetical protein A2U01_0064558, partial [Trifolium medium]|nr:hypothetical protein [Trifolium medium]